MRNLVKQLVAKVDPMKANQAIRFLAWYLVMWMAMAACIDLGVAVGTHGRLDCGLFNSWQAGEWSSSIVAGLGLYEDPTLWSPLYQVPNCA